MRNAEELFTTAEAAVLAETPPSAVEKAIEEGIIEVRKGRARKAGVRRRRLLTSRSLLYVAFLKRCDLQISRRHKHLLWNRFKATRPDHLLTARWEIAPGVHIRPGELLASIHKRVRWYV